MNRVQLKNTFSTQRLMLGVGFLFAQTVAQVILDFMSAMWVQVLWTVILLGGFGILSWKAQREFHASQRSLSVGRSGEEKLSRRRGMVILTGLSGAEASGSIAQLLAKAGSVEYVALLGTPQTREVGVVTQIVERLVPLCGHEVGASHVRVWEYGNAESLADFRQSTKEALSWMLDAGLSAEEIVVDITQGRRPMTYGASMAAEEAAVEVQYLASHWDHRNNRPIEGSTMFKVMEERYQA